MGMEGPLVGDMHPVDTTVRQVPSRRTIGDNVLVDMSSTVGTDELRMTSGDLIPFGDQAGAAIATDDDDWHIIFIHFNGASSVAYYDGGPAIPLNLGATTSMAALTINCTFGQTNGGQSGTAEIAVYDILPDATYLNQLGSYYSGKFGLPFATI